MLVPYHILLTQIRDMLTSDTWINGSEFEESNSRRICMCPHGAAQVLVNPQVKKIWADPESIEALFNASFRGNYSPVSLGHLVESMQERYGVEALWTKRPAYIKSDIIIDDINYGNGNLHYLMAMLGITTKFNDAPDRSFQEVQDKLNESIEWASRNADFLTNN